MPFDPVRLCHESPTAAAFERAVLASLETQVGFDVAVFLVKGDEESATVMGLDETTLHRALRLGETHPHELAPVKRAALAGRGVAVDTEVLGAAAVRKTRYHQEIATPLGGRHSMMGYLRLRGQVIAALMLGRCGGAFTERDKLAVEALLPGLAVARASYGLPCPAEPLPLLEPRAPAPPWLRWLGASPRSRTLACVTAAHGNIEVRDRAGYREMVASSDGAELIWSRASLEDPARSGWPYIELFHLAAALSTRRRSVLFIGLGGGVAVRQFARVYPGIAIDVVEREPAVVDLARAYYGLDSIPGVTVHTDDGLRFLSRARPSTWDVIVLDAYDAGDLEPRFAARSLFGLVKRALRPGGAMAINVIGTLEGRSPVRDVLRAARAELSDVRVVPVMTADEAYSPGARRNVVVVATRPAADAPDVDAPDVDAPDVDATDVDATDVNVTRSR